MPPAQNTTSPEDVGAIYDAHVDLLWSIAAHKFRLADADIEEIIQNVFLRYLRHRAKVGNPRAWLIASVCNACRNHYRDRKMGEPLSDDAAVDPRQIADEIAARLDAVTLLAAIDPECRALLALRFLEDLQPAEIAARCAIKTGNARVRVHRCVQALRTAWEARRRG